MKVRIGVCASCGARYRMPLDYPSTKAKCAHCSGTVEIPLEPTEVKTPQGVRKQPQPQSPPREKTAASEAAPSDSSEASAQKPPAAPGKAKGSTLEKILARKRAEAARKSGTAHGTPPSAPTRKPVLKASHAGHPPSSGQRKRREREKTAEPEKATRHKGGRPSSRGHRPVGAHGARHAHQRHGRAGDAHEEHQHGHYVERKQGQGLLWASLAGVAVIIIAAIFVFSGENKDKKENTPLLAASPPARSEEPAQKPPIVEETPPVVEQPKPEAPKPKPKPEPKTPGVAIDFNTELRDGLKKIAFSTIPPQVAEGVQVLAAGMPSKWARDDAYKAFDSNPQAAYASAYNTMVALARKEFSGKLKVENASNLEDLIQRCYELHNVLRYVSGRQLDTEKNGRIEFASQIKEEDVKKLAEMNRCQNSNMNEMKAWHDLWVNGKLEDPDSWNAMIARFKNHGVRASKDTSGTEEEPEDVPPDDDGFGG